MLLVAIDFAEFTLTHVDEVIDELLTTDYSCDIAMPRIKKRYCFIVFSLSIGMFGFKDLFLLAQSITCALHDRIIIF
jgi:hypothetical protein